MRKVACFLFLTVAIIVIGCTTSPTQPLITENVVQITAPEGYTKPLIAGWELGDSSLIIKGDVSLAILGVQLSGSNTKLFYSLIGMDTTQFIKGYLIEIIDNNGRVVELMEVIPLSGIEKLELGVMNFGARPLGATELYLQIRDAEEVAKSQKLLISKFNGSSSEDHFDRTYSIRKEGGVEQADYRLDMNLWLPPKDKLLPDLSEPQETTVSSLGVTPTPIQISGVPWAELPQGTYVMDEISFYVEDDRSKQVVYIGVQLLSNGSAITLKSGSVVIPTPIQVATPAPTPLPYP